MYFSSPARIFAIFAAAENVEGQIGNQLCGKIGNRSRRSDAGDSLEPAREIVQTLAEQGAARGLLIGEGVFEGRRHCVVSKPG